jgi:tetrahydromethanopterin S-methyltransferase subunit B
MEPIDYLKNELTEINERLTEMNIQVNRIINTLIGDEKFKSKGIVQRLQEVENKQETIEDYKKKATGFIIAVIFFGEVVITLFFNYLKK